MQDSQSDKRKSAFEVHKRERVDPELRTTYTIERCFVEVRRRTRPMVCFVNVETVDRIIYSIFQRFNLEWKKIAPSSFLHKLLDITLQNNVVDILQAQGYDLRRFLHDCGNPTERSSLLCGQLQPKTRFNATPDPSY